MFDTIIYEADCSNCGKPLSDFQSKDGACMLMELTPAELYAQGQRNVNPIFYAYCDCERPSNYNEFEISLLPNVKVERTNGKKRG